MNDSDKAILTKITGALRTSFGDDNVNRLEQDETAIEICFDDGTLAIVRLAGVGRHAAP